MIQVLQNNNRAIQAQYDNLLKEHTQKIKELLEIINNAYIQAYDFRCENYNHNTNSITFSFMIKNTITNQVINIDTLKLKLRLSVIDNLRKPVQDMKDINNQTEIIFKPTFRGTRIFYTFYASPENKFEYWHDKNNSFNPIIYNDNGTVNPIHEQGREDMTFRNLSTTCMPSSNIDNDKSISHHVIKREDIARLSIKVRDRKGSKNSKTVPDVITVFLNTNITPLIDSISLRQVDIDINLSNNQLNTGKNYLKIYLSKISTNTDCGAEIEVNGKSHSISFSKTNAAVICFQIAD